MEEQIKRAVRNLNISYVFFWVLPAFLLGAGEFDLLPVGALVDNAQATYYLETAGTVSYTHLDVYKRQVNLSSSCFILYF